MSVAVVHARTSSEPQDAAEAPVKKAGRLSQSPKGKGPDRRKAERKAGDRRGALRPEQLAPSRARMAGRGLAISLHGTDLLLMALAVALTFNLANPLAVAASPFALVLPYIAGIGLLVASLTALNAYAFKPRETLATHLARVSAAFALAGIATLILFGPVLGLASEGPTLAPWLAATFALIYLAHITAWFIVRSLRKAGKLSQNIVLVGGGKNAERMIEAAYAAGDVNILGIFDDRADRGPPMIRGVPVLGDINLLLSHKVMPFVDKVVIAVPSAAQDRVRQLIDRLRVLPNPITLFVDIEGELRGDSIARVANAPLAYLSGAPNDEMRAAIKRAQDLVIGVTALVLALPVMALIALAVKLDSRGPIFFKQRRHGFNNEEIVVWKFRTMRVEATDHSAKRQVQAGDNRVTRVGRVLRKFSLDELPQIVNVLSGEMSLVGPRPHAIGMMTGDTESHALVAEYAHRHRMKPGMAGWAAIQGSRGPVDTPALVRRRVALDIEYVERQSFWLDMYIMAMTIPCLVFGDSDAVR